MDGKITKSNKKVMSSGKFCSTASKYMVVVFIPFLYLQASIVNIEGLKGNVPIINRLDEAFVLLIFILLIIAFPKKIFKKNKTIIKLLIVYLIHASFSALYNDIEIEVYLLSVFLFLKGYLLYLSVSSLNWSKKEEKNLVWTVILFTTICTLIAIMQVFGFPFPWALDYRKYFGFYSATSIFNQHTLWATASSLGVLLAVSGIFTFPLSKKYKIIAIFLIIGLLLSTSRRHLISIPFSCLSYIWIFSQRKYKYKRFLKYSLIVFVLFVFCFPLIKTAVVGTYFEYVVNAESRDRYALYLGGFTLASESPFFGRGPGTYGSWPSVLFESPVYRELGIDNLVKEKVMNGAPYASTLGESGFVGFLLQFLIFMYVFRKIIIAGRENLLPPYYKLIVVATFLIFVNGLLESVVHPFFTGSIATYLFFIFFGIVNSKENITSFTK